MMNGVVPDRSSTTVTFRSQSDVRQRVPLTGRGDGRAPRSRAGPTLAAGTSSSALGAQIFSSVDALDRCLGMQALPG